MSKRKGEEEGEEGERDRDRKRICLTNKLKELKEAPQPAQRTKEWYAFRYNLITASNAYKAFESQAMQNQLIYEKCKPLITVNTLTENKMLSEDDVKKKPAKRLGLNNLFEMFGGPRKDSSSKIWVIG